MEWVLHMNWHHLPYVKCIWFEYRTHLFWEKWKKWIWHLYQIHLCVHKCILQFNQSHLPHKRISVIFRKMHPIDILEAFRMNLTCKADAFLANGSYNLIRSIFEVLPICQRMAPTYILDTFKWFQHVNWIHFQQMIPTY